MMRQLIVLLVICLGLGLQAAPLVENGQPRAQIVIAESPPRMVTLAAEELQAHLEAISGATLPIVSTPDAALSQRIYVGESDFTRELGLSTEGLEDDGFRMISGDTWLALIGQDADYQPREPYARSSGDRARAAAEWDKLTGARWAHPGVSTFKAYNSALQVWANDQRGSLNAVYGFLRSLGVRWYAPGDFGTIIPQQATILLPKVNEAVKPAVAHRNMMFYGDRFFMADRDHALWQLRLGLNWRNGTGGHGIDWVLHHDNTRRDHPEYFIMVNGERDTVTRGGKPCLSSPGLLQANIEFARTYFDMYDELILSVMPTDAYSNLCQCELCADKGTPERGYQGQLSDYVWNYVNEVAKAVYETHPDRLISCFAYSSYLLPPESIDQLSPNVLVGICQGRANFHNESIRESFLDLREQWLAKLSGEKQLFTWEYYLHARPSRSFAGLPVYFPRLIAEDLASLDGHHMGEGIEVYSERGGTPDPSFATYQLNCYVTARLWWDPQQDVEALLAEFYTLFYGPAAEQMKGFIEYSEANWHRMPKELEPVETALALMDKAVEAAGGDSIYASRVAWVNDYIQPLRPLAKQLAKGRDNVPGARVYARYGMDVTIDGKLDEPFWQGQSTYGLREVQTGRPAVFKTSFRACWMDDNLYFAIQCREPDMANLMVTATEDGDTAIWDGDCVEILLETQTHAYYQLAISPAGALVDIDRANGIDTLWSSQAEIATHHGEDAWTIEIRIPVAGELQAEVEPDKLISGRRPSMTYPWYFNIGRQRKRAQSMELSLFSPSSETHFHVPRRFGRLYMEK